MAIKISAGEVVVLDSSRSRSIQTLRRVLIMHPARSAPARLILPPSPVLPIVVHPQEFKGSSQGAVAEVMGADGPMTELLERQGRLEARLEQAPGDEALSDQLAEVRGRERSTTLGSYVVATSARPMTWFLHTSDRGLGAVYRTHHDLPVFARCTSSYRR
jgi:hypothetical protein